MQFDCRKCCACCYARTAASYRRGNGAYVRLRGDDYERLPAEYKALVIEGCLAIRENTACVALRGAPGDGRCAIYDRRPASCAAYKPGTPACLEARRRVAL